MATHRLLFSQAVSDRATPRAQPTGTAQRDLLPDQDCLPVAQPADSLCAVGHRLSLLPHLEAQWFVGRHSHPLVGTGTPSGRAPTPSQRGHHRQSERQEHRDERRAGLRRRQESQRTQAAYPGRYHRFAPPGDGSARQHSGSGWGQQLLAAFFRKATPRRVKHIWADGGYAGALLDWARRLCRCPIEIVKRSDLHTFKVLPRRWVVERTFGWLGRYRRLNRDYERQAKTGETMVYLAMIRLMLKRLG